MEAKLSEIPGERSTLEIGIHLQSVEAPYLIFNAHFPKSWEVIRGELLHLAQVSVSELRKQTSLVKEVEKLNLLLRCVVLGD